MGKLYKVINGTLLQLSIEDYWTNSKEVFKDGTFIQVTSINEYARCRASYKREGIEHLAFITLNGANVQWLFRTIYNSFADHWLESVRPYVIDIIDTENSFIHNRS